MVPQTDKYIKKKKWQERINYVVENYEDGKTSWTGQSVNYGCICSSWESVEDLKKGMKAMISVWVEHAQDMLKEEDPLEMKELTPEEWEAKEDNIDYWEIERMKRIMQRPSIQEKFKKIISKTLHQEIWNREDEVADEVIQVLINQENK